ncbi:hypothetical protein D3C71_748400 [compost metagenome]
MATVSSTLKMFDAMTGPLKNITNSMNIMISAMQRMQSATNSNANIDRSLVAAKQQITAAEAEINRQIQNAQRSQDNFNNSVKKSRSSVDSLGLSVIAVNQGLELMQKGWGVLNRTMNLSDEMQSANARLALINDGTKTQLGLQLQVLDVANRTRAKYADTASFVTKLGAGTQGVFKNNDQLLKFAERFNKTLVISGTTAVEASNAILQMGQALGSGVLQGDELRSLSEAAPVMMRVLSDGLGVARGQLKKLGADGELTADKIVEAFAKQSAQIDAMFQGIPMTFGGAMTVLDNTFKTWFATLGTADGPLTNITNQVLLLNAYLQSPEGQNFFNGIASGIATAIGWLMQFVQFLGSVHAYFTENWSIIGPLIWGITAAFIGLMAATKGAAMAQSLFNAIMNMNPILRIILLVSSLILFFYKLWETNDQFAAAFMRGWNKILNFFDQVPIFFTRVGYGIADAFDWARVTVLKLVENMANGVIDTINSLINALNSITGASISTVDRVEFAASAAVEAEARKQARNADISSMEKVASNKAAEREAKVQKMLNDRASKRATDTAKKVKINAGPVGSKYSLFDPNSPSVSDDKKKKTIDKVNKVGKIEDKVDISSEDLKVMRELAEMKTIQNFVTLTPTVHMNTGDINSGDDVDTIMSKIAKTITEEIASGAAGVYGHG